MVPDHKDSHRLASDNAEQKMVGKARQVGATQATLALGE